MTFHGAYPSAVARMFDFSDVLKGTVTYGRKVSPESECANKGNPHPKRLRKVA